MKLNIKIIALWAFLALGFTSCEDNGYEDYTPKEGPKAALALSGEWYIDIIDVDGTTVLAHKLHKTYDSNDGQLWISDRLTPTTFSGWWLVGKVNYDVNNLTFSAPAALNEADQSIINITEGKILKNAAHSADGNVTDSIYFKAEFDYEPGRVLTFAGHRRTGFLEDEL